MKHHVIDTNVLLVASAAHPYSPFCDTHVPVQLRETVLDWVIQFRDDPTRLLVLDTAFEIYNEYRRKLTDQDFGLQVIHEAMKTLVAVEIEFDSDGNGIVPAPLQRLDCSDRKLAAAALAGPPPTTLVNCTDSDWIEHEEPCKEVGLVVEHLLETWLRTSQRPH